MTIIVEPTRTVTGGVDTHLDVHVAAVLNEIGGLLATESFDANRAGEDSLLGWMESFGHVACVGVEGTGSYGADLARLFAASGTKVVEVDRQTGKYADARARPTRSTPSKQPVQPSPAVRPAKPNRVTATPRRSER